jgi:hypothetical protein
MSAEVFAWKSSGRGPHNKVEICDTTLSIEQDDQALAIRLDEINRVYIASFYSSPVSHMLNVEIVDAEGNSVIFQDSGFGPPDSDAIECKNAALALIYRLAKCQAAAKVYHGLRPDRPGRFLIAGVILLGFVALIWATLYFLFDKPEHAKGLAIVLSACFIFGAFWSARKARNQPEISIQDMLKRLESLHL